MRDYSVNLVRKDLGIKSLIERRGGGERK